MLQAAIEFSKNSSTVTLNLFANLQRKTMLPLHKIKDFSPNFLSFPHSLPSCLPLPLPHIFYVFLIFYLGIHLRY